MVLAKIYSIPIDHFASFCGSNFSDYDAVLPYEENQFSRDSSLTLQLNPDTTCSSSKSKRSDFIEIYVRCRYFTSQEIEKLEAKSNQENLTYDAADGAKYLHLIICEDEARKLGLLSGQIVKIDFIPTKLSRVILTANYNKNIIQDSNFLMYNSQNLRFEDGDCYVGKKIINVICDKEIELKVVDCEPVSHGITDQNTQWILLDVTCDSHIHGKSSYNDCNNEKMTTETIFNMKTHFSKQSLLIAGFASPLKELWMADNPPDQTVQLKIETNHWNTLHYSFINSFKNKWGLDHKDTHCLYVSMETLMELGVQNGCWVKVWIQERSVCHTSAGHKIKQPENENPQSLQNSVQGTATEDCKSSSVKCDEKSSDELHVSSNHYHYAQVFAIHPTSKALDIYIPEDQHIHVIGMEEYTNKTRKTVHISPLLFFNLLHGDATGTSKCEELYLHLILETGLTVSLYPSSTSSMPFAQDAQLSLINTPFYKPGDTFDDSLKRYFSKPRLLTVGEVLRVDFNATKDGVDSVISEEWYNLHTIYFKVKRLVSGGKDKGSCLVDMLKTTVYQVICADSKGE